MKSASAAFALFLAIFLQVVGPAQAASQADVVVDEHVVGIKPEALGQAADIHAKAGGRLHQQLARRPVQVVKVDATRAAAVRAAYQQDSRVRFVEPNVRVRAKALPNDPGLAEQWDLSRIGATDAWA